MTEPYYNISNNITNTSSTVYPTRCIESNCGDDEIFSEDWERTVSISVFILFGLIFIAGLIGNGLVVLGMLKLKLSEKRELIIRVSVLFPSSWNKSIAPPPPRNKKRFSLTKFMAFKSHIINLASSFFFGLWLNLINSPSNLFSFLQS